MKTSIIIAAVIWSTAAAMAQDGGKGFVWPPGLEPPIVRQQIDAQRRAEQQHKYSIDEIDQMRRILQEMLSPYCPGNSVCSSSPIDDAVERQLRTYMLNGTTPQELQDKLDIRRAPAPGHQEGK